MPGVCKHCGEVVRKLNSCPVCSAQVCEDCLEEFGCMICHGHQEVDDEPDVEDEIPHGFEEF